MQFTASCGVLLEATSSYLFHPLIPTVPQLQLVLKELKGAGIVDETKEIKRLYKTRVPLLKFVDSSTGTSCTSWLPTYNLKKLLQPWWYSELHQTTDLALSESTRVV